MNRIDVIGASEIDRRVLADLAEDQAKTQKSHATLTLISQRVKCVQKCAWKKPKRRQQNQHELHDNETPEGPVRSACSQK